MKYEIYEQDYDKIVSEKVSRYFTTNKITAFKFLQEKNKIAGKNVWRVAVCINNRICFDIDVKDIDNLKLVYQFYSSLFKTNFKVFETLNGYHLISKKRYTDNLLWQFDVCRVMYPSLQKEELQLYIESLVHLAKGILKNQAQLNTDKQLFLDFYNNEILKSGLFLGIGIFDLYFCTNVIVRGNYCIRISKKSKDDNPKEVFQNGEIDKLK